MARDRLPAWPSLSADDFASAYREHANLGRWIVEHAPVDVVRQLGEVSLGHPDTLNAEHARAGAEGDVTNLVAAQRRRNAWVGRHQAEIARWSWLERGLRRHEYRLGQAAAYSHPDHTAAVLGPLPERIAGVERWQSAAGAIEAYRVRWNVTTPDALGPEPLDPEQCAHWQRAVGVIGSAGFAAPCGQDSGLHPAWLSSLWDRVHALDTAGPDVARDVTSMPESPQLAWSRDVDSGHDLDGGFGL
jgi:hypothetical protein